MDVTRQETTVGEGVVSTSFIGSDETILYLSVTTEGEGFNEVRTGIGSLNSDTPSITNAPISVPADFDPIRLFVELAARVALTGKLTSVDDVFTALVAIA